MKLTYASRDNYAGVGSPSHSLNSARGWKCLFCGQLATLRAFAQLHAYVRLLSGYVTALFFGTGLAVGLGISKMLE